MQANEDSTPVISKFNANAAFAVKLNVNLKRQTKLTTHTIKAKEPVKSHLLRYLHILDCIPGHQTRRGPVVTAGTFHNQSSEAWSGCSPLSHNTLIRLLKQWLPINPCTTIKKAHLLQRRTMKPLHQEGKTLCGQSNVLAINIVKDGPPAYLT